MPASKIPELHLGVRTYGRREVSDHGEISGSFDGERAIELGDRQVAVNRLFEVRRRAGPDRTFLKRRLSPFSTPGRCPPRAPSAPGRKRSWPASSPSDARGGSPPFEARYRAHRR